MEMVTALNITGPLILSSCLWLAWFFMGKRGELLVVGPDWQRQKEIGRDYRFELA